MAIQILEIFRYGRCREAKNCFLFSFQLQKQERKLLGYSSKKMSENQQIKNKNKSFMVRNNFLINSHLFPNSLSRCNSFLLFFPLVLLLCSISYCYYYYLVILFKSFKENSTDLQQTQQKKTDTRTLNQRLREITCRNRSSRKK